MWQAKLEIVYSVKTKLLYDAWRMANEYNIETKSWRKFVFTKSTFRTMFNVAYFMCVI
jgi:hypothetical protein